MFVMDRAMCKWHSYHFYLLLSVVSLFPCYKMIKCYGRFCKKQKKRSHDFSSNQLQSTEFESKNTAGWSKKNFLFSVLKQNMIFSFFSVAYWKGKKFKFPQKKLKSEGIPWNRLYLIMEMKTTQVIFDDNFIKVTLSLKISLKRCLEA